MWPSFTMASTILMISIMAIVSVTESTGASVAPNLASLSVENLLTQNATNQLVIQSLINEAQSPRRGEDMGGGGGGGGGSEDGGGGRGRHQRRAFPGPNFHPNSPINVTVQLGNNAYLPCRINNLGNKSVAWIRNRDWKILTVDRYTFISDERFRIRYEARTQTWTLQVRFVQERDQGSYVCQVNTEPKMSHFVQLSVINPTVTMAGESDLYVKSGSTVNIKCIISDAPQEPHYIFWYHDEQIVMEGNSDHQLSVTHHLPDTTVATLTIPSISLADSGNYTCAPASLKMASLMLHVLSGEHSEAMQSGTNNSTPDKITAGATGCCPLVPVLVNTLFCFLFGNI